MALFAIGAVIYVSVTIEASELRIITHYTAYGITHFYRDQWTYLISFIAFIILAVIFGIGVCIKLLAHDREPLALLYGWVNIAIIAMVLTMYIHIVGFI